MALNGGNGGNEQWRSVSRRRWKAKSQYGNGGRRNNDGVDGDRGRISSFFFSSFPDKLNAKALYEIFQNYGEIDEVFIPAKRDARGGRYGFVRFFDVEDDYYLATKLDNIFIGNRNINVNIPRFNRKQEIKLRDSGHVGFGLEVRAQEQKKSDVREAKVQKRTYASFIPGVSYAEKVKSTGHTLGGVSKVFITVDVDDHDIERFSKAYVGFVENPGSTYEMQETFNREGFFSIRITPLGANLCLLEDRVDGMVAKMLEEDGDWYKQWFKEIRPWSPKDVDDCRIAWVKCTGIPCHAWLPHVFSSISALVGEFLCADDSTRNKVKMDVARLLIKTKKMKYVDEEYDLIINDICFPVKLIEDTQSPLRLFPSESDLASSSESESDDDRNVWDEDDKMESVQQEEVAREEGEIGEVGEPLEIRKVKKVMLEVGGAKSGLAFPHMLGKT